MIYIIILGYHTYLELEGIYVQPGYPCGNFSGYCTEDQYVHLLTLIHAYTIFKKKILMLPLKFVVLVNEWTMMILSTS